MPSIGDLILFLVVFVFSLSFRAAARGLVSEWRGDNTARMMGRITLNPIPHVDVFGTLIFPLLGLMMGGMLFGWAKPVPMNPSSWRDQRTSKILVAAAGFGSNFLLALVFFVILKVLVSQGLVMFGGRGIAPFTGAGYWEPLGKLLGAGMVLNIILGIFHLFPIPPLDMSEILEEFLPYDAARSFDQIRPYGFFIILGLSLLGVFGAIFRPVLNTVFFLLAS